MTDDLLFTRFQIESRLGEGGMGVVYEAYQPELKRSVAIKTTRNLELSPSDRARFMTEAQAAARLEHPNIVPVLEFGEVDGQPYLVMPLIRGETLAERCFTKPLAPRESAEVIEILANAVQYAHDHDVLHRDIKPANVLLDANNNPRVTDFGLARILNESHPSPTKTGHGLGTIGYAAPEQVSGRKEDVGPASDVYSLGVTLIELLIGTEQLQQIVHEQSVASWMSLSTHPLRELNPDIPDSLEAICLKATMSESRRRYQSAIDFSADLNRFLRGATIVLPTMNGKADVLTATPRDRRILETQIPRSILMPSEAWMILGVLHILVALALGVRTGWWIYQNHTDVIVQQLHVVLFIVLITSSLFLMRSAGRLLQGAMSGLPTLGLLSLSAGMLSLSQALNSTDWIGQQLEVPALLVRSVLSVEAFLLTISGVQLLWGIRSYETWKSQLSELIEREHSHRHRELRTRHLARLFTHPDLRRFEPIENRDWHTLINGNVELLVITTLGKSTTKEFAFNAESLGVLQMSHPAARRRYVAFFSETQAPLILHIDELGKLIDATISETQTVHLDENRLIGRNHELNLAEIHGRFPERVLHITDDETFR